MNLDRNGYSLNWRSVKNDWPLWIVMAGLIIAGFILYPMLPEQVPSHWNWQGKVDSYASRAFGAFFAPLLAVGLYLLMLVVPLIDPRRDNYVRFAGVYRLMRWGFVLFFAGLYAVTVGVALGYNLDAGLLVKAGVALLFTLLGNIMGQLKHNYFVGIKTPWTLASEEVWQRTHRLGAKVWVLGGLICLVLSPVRALWGAYAFTACIVLMAVVPMVYSYVVFRNALKT